MTRLIAVVLSALLVLSSLVTPVLAQEAPDYVIVDPTVDFEALARATVFAGELTVDSGPPSAYRIEVPDEWNGGLVLYAHGFVGPQRAELVVQNPPLREFFIDQGFAWAASSYSANGYVIDDPIEELDALRTRFDTLTGRDAPTSTIVHGFSMGGHITGAAIERRPAAYTGALPVCGVMSDIDLFSYFTNVNLVAGALSGVDVDFPVAPDFLAGTAQQISANLGLQSGLNTPAGVQYADVVEALSGGERPTFEESLGFWNIAAAVDLDGEAGDAPTVPFLQALYGRALSAGIENPVGLPEVYNNASTIYGFPNATSPEPSEQEQQLNAAVDRFSGTAVPPFPLIEGTPQIPVLTLHNTGDLFVPLFNETVYANEVAANDLSENLVQRTVRAPGHCDFTAQELVGAFADLVAWIATDTRPEGEDLTDPTVIANRDLGCAWTSETRPGMPECDDPQVIARSGTSSVGTSLAVSGARASATSAVIARADVFADGLTGASLAGSQQAPLLLNPVDSLAPAILAELQRLGVTDVTLLGGTAALSADVEQSLVDAGLTVTRLAGSNRFATAAAIAAAIGEADGQPAEVYLAHGGGFADSVAVSGLSAFLGRPILLTETDSIPPETSSALTALGDPQTTVVGGSAVVSDAVAGDSARLAGDNRYGTSAAVVDASRNAGLRINTPWVVDGEDFADALVAGPASAAAGQVMVMVDGDDLAGSGTSTNGLLESLDDVVQDLVVVSTGGSVADASVAALLSAVTDGATVAAGAGLATADLAGTVAEEVAAILDRIEAAPPQLTVIVDHGMAATDAGLELPATQLLIFGAPAAGTPLMQAARSTAIDLPQKILVWSDDQGTHATYTDPAYLAARHGLDGVDPQLTMIGNLLPSLLGLDGDAAPTAGAPAVGRGAGLVTVGVEGTVEEVVAQIETRIEAAPPSLVQVVDHAAAAQAAGLELPPTTLMIFGAPAVGTPLMQSARSVGIDLPQKLLVWSDDDVTYVTYNTAGYLAARHGLQGVDPQLGAIDTLLPRLATGG